MSEATQKPLPRGSLTWFEIPTGNIERAAAFFRAVLAAPLIDISHDETMYLFPMHNGEVGGALVERGDRTPGPNGTLVYLRIDGTLADAMARVEPAGGALVTQATVAPNAAGTFCVIRDTEGNHVGLHAQS